jgi:hypothetical protein
MCSLSTLDLTNSRKSGTRKSGARKSDMKISEHFTLEELSFSETAVRHRLANIPDAVATANLERIAAFMEKIRTLLGNRPIVVHSGYRSPRLNKLVGGVITSAHCRGLACDFVCPMFGGPVEVALAIVRSELEYHQLILEGRMGSRQSARGSLDTSAGKSNEGVERGYLPSWHQVVTFLVT